MKYIFLIFVLFITHVVSGLNSIDDKKTNIEKKDSLWSTSGVFSFGIGQTSFTNWSAGGDNNINFSGSLFYDLNYAKDDVSWVNNIDLKYGTQFFLEKKPIKTNDQIHMSSKIGYKLDTLWSYSLLYNFDSQFSNGYKYPNDSVPISRFMAPAYLMFGIGVDYKPQKELSILISPFTNKITIVNDADLASRGAFGVEPAVYDTAGNILIPARRFKNEPGGFLKIHYQHNFGKVFSLSARFELFSSYLNKPQNMDVRCNLNTIYRFTKRAAITFTLDLIYDEDAQIKQDINGDGVDEVVGPRTQVKETLALAITMNL